ncbi:thiamine diphosphokinase [Halocynthiibacter styelae]
MSHNFMNSELAQKNTVVYDFTPILLVGGGPLRADDRDLITGFSSKIIAADGGAGHVIAAGRLPDAVIGDLDSLSDEARASVPADRLYHVKEQDSTDFEKSLSRIESPLVLGVGFTGGRLDHELAALHGLLTFPEKRCILLGAEDILFLAPPESHMTLSAGSRFSLMPLCPVRAESTGLHWPLNGNLFAPGALIGTSNKVAGDQEEQRVSVNCDAPGMLVILPRLALKAAMAALTEKPGLHAQWPAPER